MPLPKISTPYYNLELPSTGQEVEYRPFLVKEEKVLLLALESEDTKQITSAIKTVIKNCVKTKGIKKESLPTFDIEYLFLNIRGKSVGEDIEVYTDESRNEVADKFYTIRQQQKKKEGLPNHSLVDFVAPKESGVKDYVGGFVVTAGIGIEKHVERFEADHDDYNSIMLKALADRFAEAFTELMHEKVRKEIWGYAANEKLGNEDLIKESLYAQSIGGFYA